MTGTTDITIQSYRKEYQPYFERLNIAWLEAYFKVEPIDAYVLGNPEEAILNEGGAILFAAIDQQIIGTVALKYMEPGVYELTKMAVDESFRGNGAGKILCAAAIDKGRELGAHKIILYSQTGLKAAIGIYRQLGFTELPLEPGKYERADIKMQLLL
ncbi:GNAT family N-acetyltransferase [Taibaiella koreensis]|uniref:GNAT family N-acetyltransferase n=1 Tax=Taibaiella koreensis TaxID=1268548 RepID=UPI000E59D16A|nr:GNAT family N-acetyltransferase [Taibaiella koreensis]